MDTLKQKRKQNDFSNNWASPATIKRTRETDKGMGGGATYSPSAIRDI